MVHVRLQRWHCHVSKKKSLQWTVRLAVLAVTARNQCARGEEMIPTPITVSIQPALLSTLPIYIAQEKGYFDELNLKVSYREYPSGAPQIKDGVENKAWDVGQTGSVPCIIGGLQGIETAGISDDQSDGALVANEAGVLGWPPGNLSGVPIAVTPNSTGHYVVEACLSQAGFDPQQDDAFLYLQQDGVMAAMTPDAEGEAAANYGSLWAPNIYTFVESVDGAGVVCNGRSAGAKVFGGIVVRKEYGEANGDVVAKVLAAWLRAIGFLKNPMNREDSIAYMREYYAKGGVVISVSSMRQELDSRPLYNLEQQIEMLDRGSEGSGISTLDEWTMKIAEFMKKAGVLTEVAPAENFITRKYMDMINGDEFLRDYTLREDGDYIPPQPASDETDLASDTSSGSDGGNWSSARIMTLWIVPVLLLLTPLL